VEESRYPYVVALKDNIVGNLTCGGSLIAQDVVLTAAHCVLGLEVIYHLLFSAVIGRHDLDSLLGEEVSLDHVVVHPNYDNTTLVNDFALIFLSQPTSVVNEFIRVNNDEPLPDSGDMARTMGWGDTTQDVQTQILSDVLLETDLPIMSNEDCFTMIESFYDSIGLNDFVALILGVVLADFDSESMICTQEPGRDACQGDSGELTFLFV
jgi:trypsin